MSQIMARPCKCPQQSGYVAERYPGGRKSLHRGSQSPPTARPCKLQPGYAQTVRKFYDIHWYFPVSVDILYDLIQVLSVYILHKTFSPIKGGGEPRKKLLGSWGRACNGMLFTEMPCVPLQSFTFPKGSM